jgi:hypothetical protein
MVDGTEPAKNGVPRVSRNLEAPKRDRVVAQEGKSMHLPDLFLKSIPWPVGVPLIVLLVVGIILSAHRPVPK